MPIMPPPGVGTPSTTGFTPAVRPHPGIDRTSEARGVEFNNAIISALENLQSAHSATDQLARAAATGDLAAVEDYMIAATETQLLTQLTVAFRNRAIESFNEIMRMQV